MVIKCPNYHKVDGLSCYYRDAFWEEHGCRIKKGDVPCNEGFIEKRIYEKLAYPKQANWLYKS
jgi:hypothetical protein